MAHFEHYENREQAWVKHWLLERYLEMLILKIGGSWSRFIYIDAFAGPWGSRTEDLSDTSFGRAIKIMRSCQARLSEQGRSLRMHAVFFESDRKRAARLIRYAQENSTSALVVDAYHADFMSHVESIASQLKDSDFAFVLIDPTGYKEIVPSRLAPLLKKRGIEVLINLMWDFINRFWEFPQEAARLDAIFGPDRHKRADVSNLEESAGKLYTQRLKVEAGGAGGKLWATTFPVQNPEKQRTHYFLVYATHSSVGLVTFGDVAESTWHQQAQAKARRRIAMDRNAGHIDMFGDDVSGVRANRRVDAHAIREAWLSQMPVAGSEITVNYEVMAELLEECGCLPCDLQIAVRDLIKEGVVENCSTTHAAFQRRTKHFVQYAKSEQLRRLR